MAADTMQRVANCFRKLGWTGVWLQAVLAIIPLGMFAYVLFGKATGTLPSLGFPDYMALVGLAVLAFTTLWSYRYTRLAARMAADRAPELTKINRVLWVGLWAGCVGIAASVMLLFIETVRLLILFLKAPQAGVPIMRTEIESRSQWVSAIDVVSLLAELCTLMGELVVLGFTLYLLFIVTRNRHIFGDSQGDDAATSG